MGDPIAVSYGDALLRHSDLQLLKPHKWLNDQIIGFYFEYLHLNHNYGSDKICFVSPEVSQFLKLGGSDEITLFLEPLDLLNKEVIALAINNAQDPSSPGGTHWSFLVYSRQSCTYFHLDSLGKANKEDARKTAEKIHQFMKKKKMDNINNFSTNCSTSAKFSFVNVSVPRQNNGYDCGIHVLCHAEYSLHHFIIYGSPDGLQPLEESIIKKKRKEILELVDNLSQ